MSRREPTTNRQALLARVRFALAGASFVVTLAAAVALLAAIPWAVEGPDAFGPTGALTVLLSSAWIASVGCVGLLLNIRQPANRIGWLFAVLGPLVGFINGVWTYSWPVPPGFEVEYFWLSSLASFYVVALAGPGLALLFPDGRLPSARWRAPVAIVTAVFVVGGLLLTLTPGYLGDVAPTEVGRRDRAGLDSFGIAGLEPLGPLLGPLTFGGLVLLGVLGIGAVLARRRYGSPLVRAQLRWFLLAEALIPIGIVVSIAQSDSGSASALGPTVLFMGFALTPIAVAIAILRYHLYDIDVIIRRTLIYATLTAVLGVGYAVAVLVLQALLGQMTGGNTLAIAVSTLAVAGLVQPARRRIQVVVDRRFYRSRYDTSRTLEAFSRRLRDDVDLDRLTSDLVSVVDRSLQSASVSVWVRNR